MTTLQLKINGEPFEIELHDGVQVSVQDGKMVVRNGSTQDASRATSGFIPWSEVRRIFGDDTAFIGSI